jgi:hypothetical protein
MVMGANAAMSAGMVVLRVAVKDLRLPDRFSHHRRRNFCCIMRILVRTAEALVAVLCPI